VLRKNSEVDAGGRGRRAQRRAAAGFATVAHGLLRSSLAAAMTRSGSNPNFS
jgi:hypothetical protein